LESGGMSYSTKIAYSISKIPIPRNERKQTGPKEKYFLHKRPLYSIDTQANKNTLQII
jgi:hypothetical protein